MKREELINKVHDLFMRYGIKSLTMDDIAQNLKVSKKTVYSVVKDKAELVSAVMDVACEKDKSVANHIMETFDNAIDEVVEITKYVSNMLRQMHPSIYYDLEKYYPEAWKKLNNLKNEFHYKIITKNLEIGVKQGLYRPNLNPPVIAKIYIQKIDLVFTGEIFSTSKYRLDEVFDELMRYHIYGIASTKGIDYLKEKLKTENLNLL